MPSLILWIIASLLLYAALTNGLWALEHLPAGRRRSLPAALADARLRALGLGLYWIGIPVLAVLSRAPGLRPSQMGLPDRIAASALPATPEIFRTGVVVIGLAGLVVLGLLASRRWFDRCMASPRSWSWRRPGPADLGRVALLALALEIHWAFFRSGVLSLGLANPSAALYLALGLLALEGWSNPAQRAAALELEASRAQSATAALAVLSLLVFLATGSLAWCLAAHLAAGTALACVLTTEPVAAPAPAADPLAGIEPTVV